jgi:hypothetical protein
MGCLGHTSLSLQPTLLAKSALNVSRSDMTREKCMTTCKDNGKTGWAAVQGKQYVPSQMGLKPCTLLTFGTCRRCYCGNDFALGDNTFLPDSYCATPCPGSSKELCGSQISVSIFNLTNYGAQGSNGLNSGTSKSTVAGQAF